MSLLSPGVFAGWLLPWMAMVALHGMLLGYGQPFGGQQSDDDYHYYSYAARFDAPNPRQLAAYQPVVEADAVTDVYDESRIKISFSRFLPYPGWTWLLHVIHRMTGWAYPAAAFSLFLLQSGLLIAGCQLLASAMAPPARAGWWRLIAGFLCAGMIGFEGIASWLLSIPMHFAVALSLLALGLLVYGRKAWGAALLATACSMHVAGIFLFAYVLTVWAVYQALSHPTARAAVWVRDVLVVAAIVVLSWTALHYVILGIGSAGMSGGLRIGFDKARLDFLVRGHEWFFPLVGGAGLLGCALAARAGENRWRLPLACFAASLLYASGFAFLGNKYVNHPTLYPLGRLLYLLPLLSVLMAVFSLMLALSAGRSLGFAARAAAAAALVAVGIVCLRQNSRVVAQQFVPRRGGSLGPLHARLTHWSKSADAAQTTFVYRNHEFGTVLSAAGLYNGTYLWAKVYSPKALNQAAARRGRIVYFLAEDEPAISVPGFCVARQETVALGMDPAGYSSAAVRMIEAERC